jgi:hypothetical protein
MKADRRRTPHVSSVAAAAAVAAMGVFCPCSSNVARGAERVSVVATSGQAAGGVSGGNFATLGAPVLNGNGAVAFGATLTGAGITSTNSVGLWMRSGVGLTNLARTGDPVPGGSGYAYFYEGQGAPAPPDSFNDSGPISFTFEALKSPATWMANVVGLPGGPREAIVPKTPYPAPYSGTWAYEFNRVAISSGLLVVGEGHNGYWSGTSVASLSRVLSASSPPPGIPGGAFDGAAMFSPMVNRSGALVNQGSIQLGGQSLAIFAGTSAASVTKIAFKGDAVPSVGSGYTLSRVVEGANLNDAGQVLIHADVQTTRPSNAASALFVTNAGGGPLQKIVLSTDRAPGFAPGITLGSVDNSRLAGDGSVYFTARLNNNTNSLNDASVWRYAGGTLSRVFDSYSQVVGAPAGTTAFLLYKQLVTNAVGQLAFSTSLRLPDGGSGSAIIGFDPSLGSVVLTRVGDSVTLAPGDVRTIAAISVNPSYTNGLSGYASDLNDQGVFAYQATFTDKTQAILTTRIPVAGDTNYDGIVDRTDLATLLAHYGQAGTRADGDFNLDGVVGFRDFQMLELNYGRTPPGVSAGAVDELELGAAAQSVPEPGGGWASLRWAGCCSGVGAGRDGLGRVDHCPGPYCSIDY